MARVLAHRPELPFDGEVRTRAIAVGFDLVVPRSRMARKARRSWMNSWRITRAWG